MGGSGVGKAKGRVSQETGSCADTSLRRSDVRKPERAVCLSSWSLACCIFLQFPISPVACSFSQHGGCAAPVLPCCQALLPAEIEASPFHVPGQENESGLFVGTCPYWHYLTHCAWMLGQLCLSSLCSESVLRN